MQLFYNPDIDSTTENFSFDKVESKHIIKVLRKKHKVVEGSKKQVKPLQENK